jgi:hypothetical protein
MFKLPMIAFEWNEDLKKIQEWGSQFINHDAALELYQITKDRHNIVARILKDEIPQWIKSIVGENIDYVQLFSAEKNSVGFLHKDGFNRRCAFNVPISGASQGYIEWYSGIDQEREYENDTTQIRLLEKDADITKLRIIYRSKTSVPSLLDTDVWHRVDNRNNDNWRHVLSFRFEDNPTFESVRTQLLTVKKLRRLVPHNPHH